MKACVVPGVFKLGFRRFNKYLREHRLYLVNANHRARMRVMADLLINPPLEEAQMIVKNSVLTEKRHELVQQYRALEDMTPLFCCTFCNERFFSNKLLEKHQSRRYDHIRFIQSEELWQSQRATLRRAKFLMTGTNFPCFYQLVNMRFLPSSHSPQIFDVRGIDGRPIGIISDDQLVRVEDVMGDWIKVRHENRFGWCRFRIHHGGLDVTVMEPAMRSHGSATGLAKLGSSLKNIGTRLGGGMAKSAGSDRFWKGLKMWDKPKYFVMGRDLGDDAEAKVRTKPTKDGRIVGHVAKGLVVEAWAVHGHWLQVRYDELAVAWVPWRVKNSMLIEGMRCNAQRLITIGQEEPELRYFRGTLFKKKEEQKWDVHFDDGIQLKDVPEKQIQGLEYTLLFNKLHTSLQMRLRNTVKTSPVLLHPSALEVSEADESIVEDAEKAREDGVDQKELMPEADYEGGIGDGTK
jgi:hypothetical protein